MNGGGGKIFLASSVFVSLLLTFCFAMFWFSVVHSCLKFDSEESRMFHFKLFNMLISAVVFFFFFDKIDLFCSSNMKNYLTRIKKEARKNVYRRGAGGGGGGQYC